MSVEFDFAIGDRTFRVIRKYAKPKTHTARDTRYLNFRQQRMAVSGPYQVIPYHRPNRRYAMSYIWITRLLLTAFFYARAMPTSLPTNDLQRKDVLANILASLNTMNMKEELREAMRTWEESIGKLQFTIEDYTRELAQSRGEAELLQAQRRTSRCG